MKKKYIYSVTVLILIIAIIYFRNSHSQTITAEKAIQIVTNLPAVKKWEQLFTNPDGTSPKTGGRPIIDDVTETTDENYIIRAYEDMPDHTANFGWYEVNKITGIVTESFIPK